MSNDGRLTTHALDTARGCGAGGLVVDVRQVLPHAKALGAATLDEGGRGVLLAEGLEKGVYELVFRVADYHRAIGLDLPDPPFLDVVTIRFGVSDPSVHHHVPILVSPYGYTTYRGG